MLGIAFEGSDCVVRVLARRKPAMPLLTSCASLLELAKRMTTGLVISKPGATAKPVPVDTWALAQGSTAKASSARSILFKLNSFTKALR